MGPYSGGTFGSKNDTLRNPGQGRKAFLATVFRPSEGRFGCMSEIQVRWEASVNRPISTGGTRWVGDSLLLSHVDGKGISFFDPVGRCERWEYRLKGDVVAEVSTVGDWIIIRGSQAYHLINCSTGKGEIARNLKNDDSFRFASDSHAIFVPRKYGTASLDLASGKVARFPDLKEELTAWTGSGDFFLASDLAVAPASYYVGRLEPGTGRLLKGSAQPFTMPVAKERLLLAVSSAGFALASANDDVLIWVYSWSGKLLMELEIRGYQLTNLMGVKAKFLLSPSGELEGLLVTYFSETRTRIFLLDLKNKGDISCSAEVVGPMFATLPMIGDYLFWNTYGLEGGERIGMCLNLANGEAAPFIDEPVSTWMATDGCGLFFGKEKKGQNHIAYGELAQ